MEHVQEKRLDLDVCWIYVEYVTLEGEQWLEANLESHLLKVLEKLVVRENLEFNHIVHFIIKSSNECKIIWSFLIVGG
jgi:hypothetical protein